MKRAVLLCLLHIACCFGVMQIFVIFLSRKLLELQSNSSLVFRELTVLELVTSGLFISKALYLFTELYFVRLFRLPFVGQGL